MSTFVLLHGAFRGAWAWSPVVDLLEQDGHSAIAPDLPAAGERYVAGMTPPSLRDTIEDVVALFERHGLSDVILAGHSQGGFIARAASQYLADRIATLAYLDAPVPRHGDAARDLMPGGPFPPMRMPEWIEPPPSDAPWAARLTPVPSIISTEPVTLTDPRALALPERYAFFSRTPPTFPCAHTRARLDAAGVPYDVLDADHDAPLTAPGGVHAWLVSLTKDVVR